MMGQNEKQASTTTNERSAGNWAQPVTRLTAPAIPGSAVNLNVEGRQLSGPLLGFGQMWQKTYRIPLAGSRATPQEVIEVWKANFAKFWPAGNRFYGADGPIAAGQVAVLNLAGPGGMTAPGGGPIISTGILVIYSDDESFSFMTPQGHMFAGMNTFSAEPGEDGPVVQMQALIRASDPIWELGSRLRVVGPNEDRFWHGTLKNLAAHFGVTGEVSQQNQLVDPRVQWAQWRNVWHNAAVRTTLYTLATPVRWAGSLMRGENWPA